jgi:hypothetical protein
MTMLSGTGIQEALEQGDLKVEPLSPEGHPALFCGPSAGSQISALERGGNP